MYVNPRGKPIFDSILAFLSNGERETSRTNDIFPSVSGLYIFDIKLNGNGAVTLRHKTCLHSLYLIHLSKNLE